MKMPFGKTILKVILFLCLMFGCNSVFAYTTVSGTISNNTTWTGGTTYYISAATTLSSGYTLTIEPGAIVKFYNGVRLTINGTLNVAGVSGNDAIFTSKNDNSVGEIITGSTGSPAKGNWDRIEINGAGANSSNVNYAQVRYSQYGFVLINTSASINNSLIEDCSVNGIYINSTTASPSVQNSTIRNNSGYGVYLYSGGGTINNNNISNSYHGIFLNTGSYAITNNVIQNDTYDGIYISTGTATITGNTINGNRYGINAPDLDVRLVGQDTMVDNTISANASGQVISRGFNLSTTSGTIDGSNNDILIFGSTALSSGKTINISPGSIIKVANSYGIYINGVVNVNGTSTGHVIFTSINDQSIGSETLGSGTPGRGNWARIEINGTGTSGSIVDYAEIRYPQYGFALGTTDVSINNSLIEECSGNGVHMNSISSSPSLNNSTVRNISSYGIHLYSGGGTVNNNSISSSYHGIYINSGSYTITNNTIQNNTYDGIYISTGTAAITGNTINNNRYGINAPDLDVRLVGQDTMVDNTISANASGQVISRGFNFSTTSGTIDGSNNDILIFGSTALSSGKTINISPGSIIKVANSYGIYINGVVNVNGTSTGHVIFTSINDQSVGSEILGNGSPGRGNWARIEINGVGTNGSLVDYAEVRYPQYGFVLTNTNAIVDNSLSEECSGNGVHINSTIATPTVQNSTIRNITSYGVDLHAGNGTLNSNTITNTYDGVYITAGGSYTITNNTVQNNSYYGIYLSTGTASVTGNIISNNTYDGIYINIGTASITGNTINNNNRYGINAPDLDVRLVGQDVLLNNTISSNPSGLVVSRGFTFTSSSGTIDGSSNDILLIGSTALSSGKTINISPGSVIKIANSQSITVNGVINVNGTSAGHVIFTSINDQSVGSETLGTGTPARGNWNRITITGAGTNGSNVNYAEVRYPTYGFALGTTDVTINNSLIEECSSDGVHMNSVSSSPSLTNSVVRNISGYGVNLYAGGGTVDYSSISSSSYGIYVRIGSYMVTNNTIENNTYDGIYLDTGTATITGNTISNNNRYGINAPDLNVRLVGQDAFLNNTVFSNTSGQVVSRGFNFTPVTGTIDGSSSDIILIGSTALSSGKTINISPGSIIKVANGQAITINGIINANGTSTGHIVFTSINDQSIGSEILGTGTPGRGNWDRITIDGAGTNGSSVNYAEVRYPTYGIAFGTSNNTYVTNSLFEECSINGIHLNGAYTINVKNSTFKNNTSQGIYVYSGDHNIFNNNLLDNNNDGIFVRLGNSSIKNNIIKGNGRYGVYYSGGTPIISYNLFFQNATADTLNWTLTGSNIVGLDPLFTPGTEYLSSGSPAINTGDPTFGNHPVSGNRYDIGRYEYTGYAPMVFTASVSGVSGRTLSYEWSFTQDPTNGSNPPVITNSTGSISVDKNVSCSFDVTKLGNYSLKLVIKEGATVVGESTNNFTIVAP